MESLSARPFLIKPNNHEVGRIFDANPETPEEAMPFAHKLHELGAQNVIISCGGHGAALVDEFGEEHTVPTAKIKLVNATGAGDSMVAGFVTGMIESNDYMTAFRMGLCTGSASAFSPDLATRPEVEALLANLPVIE
jgi:1-phosphofructokinase